MATYFNSSRILILASMFLLSLSSCDEENPEASNLQPIVASIAKNGGGISSSNCPSATAKGEAQFENNLGLDSFCINYEDLGDGTVEFSFFKQTEEGKGIVKLALPETSVGHVWDFSTRDVQLNLKESEDRCDMLKSYSRYPLVSIDGLGEQSSIHLASTDCPSDTNFVVRINTLAVAKNPGEKWHYEVDARLESAKSAEPFFVRGSFAVEKKAL